MYRERSFTCVCSYAVYECSQTGYSDTSYSDTSYETHDPMRRTPASPGDAGAPVLAVAEREEVSRGIASLADQAMSR